MQVNEIDVPSRYIINSYASCEILNFLFAGIGTIVSQTPRRA